MWGVDFETNIFLSHQDYQGNIYQVQDEIDSISKEIEMASRSILMYCSGTPKDVILADADDAIYYIMTEVDELINGIKESSIKLYQLELYKEYLEELNKKNENKD